MSLPLSHNDTSSISYVLAREFEVLSKKHRAGWLLRGVPVGKCETVWEHSRDVGLLGAEYAKRYHPQLNPFLVFAMGVIHDIGETRIPDYTPHDGVSREEKFRQEHTAVQDIFSGVEKGQEYINLWLEFEERKTATARYVKEWDQLQMVMQASRYRAAGFNGMEEFYESARPKIVSAELVDLFDRFVK